MRKLFCSILLWSLITVEIFADIMYVSRLGNKNIFINQMNTGIYYYDNCGPTSLAMIFNYLLIPYDSVSYLRYKIRNMSGWVYTNEIEDYLCNESIAYNIEYVENANDFVRLINDGNIILLCLDVSKISYSSGKNIGRTYSNVTGHFVTVSGYYKDDDKFYFEVLDPMNYEVRYYQADELINSVTSWWSYCFVFNKDMYGSD